MFFLQLCIWVVYVLNPLRIFLQCKRRKNQSGYPIAPSHLLLDTPSRPAAGTTACPLQCLPRVRSLKPKPSSGTCSCLAPHVRTAPLPTCRSRPPVSRWSHARMGEDLACPFGRRLHGYALWSIAARRPVDGRYRLPLWPATLAPRATTPHPLTLQQGGPEQPWRRIW